VRWPQERKLHVVFVRCFIINKKNSDANAPARHQKKSRASFLMMIKNLSMSPPLKPSRPRLEPSIAKKAGGQGTISYFLTEIVGGKAASSTFKFADSHECHSTSHRSRTPDDPHTIGTYTDTTCIYLSFSKSKITIRPTPDVGTWEKTLPADVFPNLVLHIRGRTSPFDKSGKISINNKDARILWWLWERALITHSPKQARIGHYRQPKCNQGNKHSFLLIKTTKPL